MAAETQDATASSSTFEEDIKKLMGKGKVHLVCNENLEAVKCFEEATKKLDEKYGQDLANECGEAYYYYGKSLLEVARMEGGVLGNALQEAIEVQENGDGEPSTDQKSVEDKKDKNEKTTEDEEKKDKNFYVGPDINEIAEEEKEKIGMDVTYAMTEQAFKEAMEEDKKEKEGKPEKKEKTPEETKEAEKSSTEKKDEKAEESKSEEKEGSSEEKKDGEEKEENAKVKGAEKSATEKKDEKTEEIKASSEEKKDGEEKEESAKVKEAETTTTEKKDEKPDESKSEEKEGSSEEKKEGEAKEDEGGEEEGGDAEPMDEEGAENAEAEQTEEDEPTYMELAWQMLEGARLIFTKREGKEAKLMLAQCHLKLGEIQMEQEQFLSAIEDFLKCLDIQKEHLEPDNRLKAETAYNIGLAFSFQSMYDKSKEYYGQALQTIDLRIKNLQNSIEEAESKSKGKEKATDDNPFVANRKELQELQELYPEIKAKVDDASEMMKQAGKKPDMSSIMGNGSSTSIGFGHTCDKDAPVTMIATKKSPAAASDISHLVHRNKRKQEEASNCDTVAKKPRQDDENTEANGKPTETTGSKTETTMEATSAES